MIILLLTFWVILPPESIGNGRITQDREWKVEVGDTKTYRLTKYYDTEDLDNNGDPNSEDFSFENIEGETINMTRQVGLTITYEIIELEPVTAPGGGRAIAQISFNGVKKKQEELDQAPVFPVIDNKSYYEKLVKGINEKDPIPPLISHFASLDGNIYTYEHTMNTTLDSTVFRISKSNWKTGWITYKYTRFEYNNGTVQFEIEDKIVENTVPGFVALPLICGLTLLTIIRIRKRKKY
jgi:hypothetical protein